MMTLPRSASRRIAIPFCVLIMFLGPVLPAPSRADNTSQWKPALNVEQLVLVLESWLDANSPYPPRSSPARIVLIDKRAARGLEPAAIWLGPGLRGFYAAETATIYLIRPWSPGNPQDESVLLHELVHHRQITARHWYCPGQQELPAYRLQQAWLQERGETGRINWISAVLASGCTPRDIHPD